MVAILHVQHVEKLSDRVGSTTMNLTALVNLARVVQSHRGPKTPRYCIAIAILVVRHHRIAIFVRTHR